MNETRKCENTWLCSMMLGPEQQGGAAGPVRTCHHKSKNGWTRIELKHGSLKMSQLLEGVACHPID